MAVIRAYLMPHPPLAVQGVGRGEENKIQKTLAALDEAAIEIAELAPDTIVFITPHNVIYADYFHISPGSAARGDMSRFNDPQTRFEAKYDPEMAAEITRLAEQSGIPAGPLGEKDAGLDHAVMVPMYFVNRRFSNYKTVRISQSGLGASEHYLMGRLIAQAAENIKRKTVLIASGDLSHKLSPGGPYGMAPEGPEFDGAVTQALASGDFPALFGIPADCRERAAECGYNSLLVLAGCFDRRKVEAKLSAYEGPFGVGYAVAGFVPGEYDESRNILDQVTEIFLAQAREKKDGEDHYRALARASLEYTVNNGQKLPFPNNLPDELLNRRAGAFVTLYKDGRLRGCIGTIAPGAANVALEIIQNAVSAGLNDYRFEPVTAGELPYLTYKVDILSAPEEITDPKQLDVKRYGVIVSSGSKRGLLLPNLDGVDAVEEQIAIARQKGNIPEHAPVKLERFEVTRYE